MGEEVKPKLKPIEITHFICGSGGWWIEGPPSAYMAGKGVLKFWGTCSVDGDMFSFHFEGNIISCKGHFNDGVI